ncbi:glycosyltransferase family 2 protein [Gemmobacter straminiformis]|uniref:Glycosyltransferase family 2 protein n=1 Tax=Paragemmobacter straminiformis TaxID=2045119 RepID=A0A842I9K4_9RHOB|nr:glycosyltransferase family 2 protein [Gemmobacter straminiformis]
MVTVSYNSAAVLGGLLRSVGDADCVVVDNGGAQPLDAIVAESGARLVRLERNEGFGRGCNAGAALAQGKNLFFVNPDAQLAPGCISALERAADSLPGFVAANPLIVDAQGRAHFRTGSILLSGSGGRGEAPAEPVGLPVLSGCALFVRRAAFEAVGGFDPAIFLYHEDHDLALRLAALGKLWHVPEAVVRHVAGTAAPRTADVAWLKGYHMARSRHYVLRKHGRPLPLLRTVLPALSGLILPHNLWSARRRSRVLGQVSGAFSSVGDHGEYSAP